MPTRKSEWHKVHGGCYRSQLDAEAKKAARRCLDSPRTRPHQANSSLVPEQDATGAHGGGAATLPPPPCAEGRLLWTRAQHIASGVVDDLQEEAIVTNPSSAVQSLQVYPPAAKVSLMLSCIYCQAREQERLAKLKMTEKALESKALESSM